MAKTKIKVRRDSTANWASVTPEDGELTYDTVTKQLKVGTGTQTFPDLTGINADTLDTHHSTDFASSAHLHSATYLGISDTAADSDKLDGQDGSYYATAANLNYLVDYNHAQHTFSGGGTVTATPETGGARLKWTARFICIPAAKTELSSDGYIALLQPTTDIPAAQVYDGASRSASADGVYIKPFEAIYAVHTTGDDAYEVLYYIVHYATAFTPGRNWILVAAYNGDSTSITLGNGAILKAGDTYYTGVTTHTHASATTGGRIAHSALSSITANDHHNQAHTLTGADHTASGLTSGHFLKATGTTTFGFAAHGLTYTDVSAASSAHTHTGTYAPVIHNLIDTTNHPVTGLTSGHFLKATGATTYGFAAHGLTYSDVSAASSGHTHTASNVGAIAAIASPEQGDILYYNGTAWVALNHGTSGQYLKTQGNGANPICADVTAGAAAYTDSTVWSANQTFSRASDSSFTVTDNAANQAIFVKGRPIRYSDDGSTFVYGIVTAYSSGTVTLAGAPMTTSYDAVLQYANTMRVMQMDLLVPGYYEDATDTTVLINDLGQTIRWQQATGYLVNIQAKTRVADSSSNGKVNVRINGSDVCTSASNAGLTLSSTSWIATTTDISTTYYDINYGEEIEVNVTKGTGGTAQDLSLVLTFVMP